MPNELHNNLTEFCKKLFPSFLTHREQWSCNFGHVPRGKRQHKPLPDLLSPDNKTAIECIVFSKDALERLYEYNEAFSELILVMPNLQNVKQIWMYDCTNNKLHKFYGHSSL